ncbi:MAG: ABC transporter permease [Verrucomicrobiota bacterium]
MGAALTNAIAGIGRSLFNFPRYFAQLAELFRETLFSLFSGQARLRLISRQIIQIGVSSQLVVIVTGAFTGAVLTAQTYFQFAEVGLETAVGGVVGVGMARELAPVLAGLMVAGRVGASMAAEIGTMKVTEQIDALRALSVHPVDHLVTPRFVAMMISMPILVAESLAFGVLFCWIMAVPVYGISEAWFFKHMLAYAGLPDLSFSLVKGFFFGIIIVIVSCHQGLRVNDGAVGVGNNTTKAVVFSSLLLLISNFFLTLILNIFFPGGFKGGA